MAIVYSLMARGSVVLTEFTVMTTNASTISSQILERISGNTDSHVKHTDGLTVLCMADDTAEIQNNCYTQHLAKLLIHLAKFLQELTSTSGAPSLIYAKAVNAAYISFVFLKYLIENAQSNNIKDLYLSLDEREPGVMDFAIVQNIETFVIHSVLGFIGSVDVRNQVVQEPTDVVDVYFESLNENELKLE